MNASAIFSSCSSLSSLRFPSGIYQVTFTSPSFSALVLKDGPIWVRGPMCHDFPPSFKKQCTKMQWELPSCRCLVTSDGDSEAIDSQILQLLAPGWWDSCHAPSPIAAPVLVQTGCWETQRLRAKPQLWPVNDCAKLVAPLDFNARVRLRS